MTWRWYRTAGDVTTPPCDEDAAAALGVDTPTVRQEHPDLVKYRMWVCAQVSAQGGGRVEVGNGGGAAVGRGGR